MKTSIFLSTSIFQVPPMYKVTVSELDEDAGKQTIVPLSRKRLDIIMGICCWRERITNSHGRKPKKFHQSGEER